VARADQLWPATPAYIPRLEEWVAEVRSALSRSARHRADFDTLRRDPLRAAIADAGWGLADQEALVRIVERFADPDPARSPLVDVEGRLAFARNLKANTVDAHRLEWDRAIREIADVALCPRYGGLRIREQVGLVPLGRDADSGLWEFALFGRSGAVPMRDRSGRRNAAQSEDGLVFVLIPGGRAWMGAQCVDPSLPAYDSGAADHELFRRAVDLDPFFISKYEVTQAQWLRTTGQNPSWWEAGSKATVGFHGWTNPLEMVSWVDAVEGLNRLDLVLPTEAQWEHAARGGTTTPWWTGSDAFSLLGRENLTFGGDPRLGETWSTSALPPTDDGFEIHAPVASFAPNPYGLYDVLGNVSEFCADTFVVHYSEHALRPGDGLVLDAESDHRSRRGGSWSLKPDHARVAHRTDSVRTYPSPEAGLRPVRRCEP